jgi:hypothetical protein
MAAICSAVSIAKVLQLAATVVPVNNMVLVKCELTRTAHAILIKLYAGTLIGDDALLAKDDLFGLCC